MKPIRRTDDLGTRVREQGRLRMGVKSGNAMKALKQWRFTSPEREPLVQLAALYGGEVRPWSDPKARQGANQFELLSKAEKIRVIIPPGGLSTWYEEWSGGGVKRRCDGETVFIDGDDQKPQRCLCDAQQVMVCKPKTRLSVVLPEVTPFGGVWRLDTGSWNAADEMAAMERMLDQLQVNGLVEAQLLIEERQLVVKGRKSRFVVPVILVSASAQTAITSGQEGNALLAGPGLLALPAAEVVDTPPPPAEDDDVEEAQIVDLPGYDRVGMDQRLDIAMDLIVQRTEYTLEQIETALALGGSGGEHRLLNGLADSHHAKAVQVAEQIAQGRRTIVRIENDRMVLS